MSKSTCISCLHYNEYYGMCMKNNVIRKSTSTAKSCFLSMSEFSEEEFINSLSESMENSFKNFNKFLVSDTGKELQRLLDEIDKTQIYLGDCIYD